MNDRLEEEIIKLRAENFGYGRIAKLLNISKDKVKYICRRNGYIGLRGNVIKKKTEVQVGEYSVCKCCGKSFEQHKRGRKRIFCSVKCKRIWERKHKRLYEHKCSYCGRIFESPSINQKFCDKDCYMKFRFYRKEDVDKIAEMLKKGKKPEFVPVWIKELLCDVQNDDIS